MLLQEEILKFDSIKKITSKDETVSTLIDLANFFKVSLDYLVGTENYIVSDNKEEYGLRMSGYEIDLISEFRKHKDLYEKLINNPKRTIELIEKKIR